MQFLLFVVTKSALFIGFLFVAFFFLISTPTFAITSTFIDDDAVAIDDTDYNEQPYIQQTIITIPFTLNGIQPIPKNSTTHHEIIAEAIELGTPNAQTTLGYGILTPNTTANNFAGMITFDEELEPGTYRMNITVPKYVTREITSALIVAPDGNATMTNSNQPVRLFAGDIDYDGIFSILDYNLLAGCMRTIDRNKSQESCSTELEELTDLNEDGLTDQIDYNLFLRSIREITASANTY